MNIFHPQRKTSNILVCLARLWATESLCLETWLKLIEQKEYIISFATAIKSPYKENEPSITTHSLYEGEKNDHSYVIWFGFLSLIACDVNETLQPRNLQYYLIFRIYL